MLTFETSVERPGVTRLKTELLLPRPLPFVFAYFADAINLESITPPSLRFRIDTPLPIEMCRGTLIDYRIRLRGIPIVWRTEISVWEPPLVFVDRQIRGPYRLWEHTHTFHETPFGTLVKDTVDYTVPGGSFIERLFVRPELTRIFSYRHKRLAQIFEDQPVSVSTCTEG